MVGRRNPGARNKSADKNVEASDTKRVCERGGRDLRDNVALLALMLSAPPLEMKPLPHMRWYRAKPRMLYCTVSRKWR
jgi:hypothetical protein